MKLCKTCGLEKTGSHASYCKSCNSARVMQWKRENGERYNEYSRNLARKLAKKSKPQRDRKRSWEKNNPEAVRGQRANWKKKNIEKVRASARVADRKRRALRLSNGFEKYTEQDVLSLYGTNCHICHGEIDLGAPRSVGALGWELALHIDHLIPISRGGEDTLKNVRPSHALCNLRKSATII